MTEEYYQGFVELITKFVGPNFTHPQRKIIELETLKQQIILNRRNGNLDHAECANLRITLIKLQFDFEDQVNN